MQASFASENTALIGMVLVPKGLYISGSNKYNDERPSRQIYLDAFYIDKFEVTQKEFKKIMILSLILSIKLISILFWYCSKSKLLPVLL